MNDNPPPNPNDYISSYLTTGAVPDPNSSRLRTSTKRQGSLGGLKDSGNSASDWKSLSANVIASDVAEKGVKLAEKMMMRKKNRKKGSSNVVEEDQYLKQAFVYDVDVDEKGENTTMHTKSQEYDFMYSKDEYYPKPPPDIPSSKPSRRRNRKVDSSDRTGEKEMNESWQTASIRRKEESPSRRKETNDFPQSPTNRRKGKSAEERHYSYEKSWSADGIRVRAVEDDSTNDDDIYDQYVKALSLNDGIRVVASNDVDETESSQFANDRTKQQQQQQQQNVDNATSHQPGKIWSYPTEPKSNVEPPTLEPERTDREFKSQTAPTAASTESNSRDMNSSEAFNLSALKSVMHEYIAKRSSMDVAAEEEPENEVEEEEVHQPHDNVPAQDVSDAEKDEMKSVDQHQEEKEEHTQQTESKTPATSPFPTKSEALPRVMSLGNLTIDLSALQATRPAKSEIKKSVELKKSVPKPPDNAVAENSSASDSEGSIKIDRSALQRSRPKKDPDEETVRTFPTTNLPWTGRFGESGMYTGLVNERYQPHGRGTMMFDHGEIKKGHWKNGGELRRPIRLLNQQHL
jgi:hypothetical protein